MAKLNIGIIGGIGSGKDTLGTAIVNALNGLVKDYAHGTVIAYVSKFAAYIHQASLIAGFSQEREDKETSVLTDIVDIMYAVNWVLGCLLDSRIANTEATKQIYRHIATTLQAYKVERDDHVLISPRTFMQLLGTTVRQYAGQDTWVKLATNVSDYSINVFTDVRHHNEVDAMDLIIKIDSDRSLESDHITEQLHKTYVPDDKCIGIFKNNKDTHISSLLQEAAILAAAIYGVVTKLNHDE